MAKYRVSDIRNIGYQKYKVSVNISFQLSIIYYWKKWVSCLWPTYIYLHIAVSVSGSFLNWRLPDRSNFSGVRRPTEMVHPSKFSFWREDQFFNYLTSWGFQKGKTLEDRTRGSEVRELSRITKKELSMNLSLIHIWRCRRYAVCRSRWSPYH